MMPSSQKAMICFAHTEEMAVSSLIDIESLEKSVWELLDALWSAWISDEDERGDDGMKTITFDEKMTGLRLINIYFMMTIVNASVSTTIRTMSWPLKLSVTSNDIMILRKSRPTSLGMLIDAVGEG